jgi:nicotinate-nucleotide pyrophosphorylase (carboxylating)
MELIRDFVHSIMSEDVGRGDLFARCQGGQNRVAVIRSKSDGVFAGSPYAQALADVCRLNLTLLVNDGDTITPGTQLLTLEGEDVALLQAERTLLNLLQHASGIATNTRAYAEKLKGSGVMLLDTRKTRPLLRRLEKYATRTGGAVNHRMGLDDCLMLKDTHLATIDDLAGFITHARGQIPFTAVVEVECESVDRARCALEAGADIIMCDNMPIEEVKEVIKLKQLIAPKAKVEASGNITLDNIDRFVDVGVDAVSTGSLIHQAVWLDFSMKMVAQGV